MELLALVPQISGASNLNGGILSACAQVVHATQEMLLRASECQVRAAGRPPCSGVGLLVVFCIIWSCFGAGRRASWNPCRSKACRKPNARFTARATTARVAS